MENVETAPIKTSIGDKIKFVFKNYLDLFEDKDSKDELIIFLTIINIMLVLVIMNFYSQEF